MAKVIPIDFIKVPSDRQRKEFDEDAIVELRASIQSDKGLINAIFVRAIEEGYALVAGERRLRAISKIDKPYMHGNTKVKPGYVPVVIREFKDEISIIEAELEENILRKDLTWDEESTAIAKLHELKAKQNPDASKSQLIRITGNAITNRDEGEYATSHSRAKVEKSLLVVNYLDDPLVKNASSLSEATKIVSRRIENEALQELRERAKMLVKQKNEVVSQNTTPEVSDSLDFLEPESELVEVDFLVPPVPEACYTMKCLDQLGEIQNSSIEIVIGDEYFDYEYTVEHFVSSLERICTPRAHIYLFCTVEDFLELKQVFMHYHNWTVKETPIIWQHEPITGIDVKVYISSYKIIFHACRGNKTYTSRIPDIITVPLHSNTYRPEQKPIDLYKKLLQMSVTPGDVILDTNAKTGMIFSAAQSFMVTAYGIEPDPTFKAMCEMSIQGIVPEWNPEY